MNSRITSDGSRHPGIRDCGRQTLQFAAEPACVLCAAYIRQSA